TALFIVIFTMSLNAQYGKKGTVELGGEAGFSSSTSVFDGESADESTTNFFISPMIGYFVIDGLQLAFIPLEFSSYSHGDYSTTSFDVWFAPGYVFDMQSNVYPFVNALIGYNTSTSKNGSEATYSGLQYGVFGGIKVLLGKNALLNVGLTYRQITSEPEDWDGDRVGGNVFAAVVGFTVFLGKK
ncbi:outer membrane beta-barrel protein, partial [Bacteroidota bacterium]